MAALVKRSLTLRGHRTSLALEPEFWSVLDEAARAERLPLATLMTRIDEGRPAGQPLASAARVWALSRAARRG